MFFDPGQPGIWKVLDFLNYCIAPYDPAGNLRLLLNRKAAAFLSFLPILVLASVAMAQSVPGDVGSRDPGDIFINDLSPAGLDDFGFGSLQTGARGTEFEPRTRRNRDYQPLVLGSWLVSPSLFLGVSYSSSSFANVSGGETGWGARVRPSIVADRYDGPHRTLVFLQADGLLSPGQGVSTLNANAGLIHVWEIERGLVVRFQARFTRTEDYGNPYGTLQNNAPVLIGRNTATNRYMGAASVTKSFGKAFVSVGYTSQWLSFERNVASNGTIHTVSGRIGYWVMPQMYVFTEYAANAQRYDIGAFDSNGQRLVAGLGISRRGLLRGELFAGMERQSYTSILLPTLAKGVFGGRVFWYPTRYITIAAQMDQSMGVNAQVTPLFNGAASHTVSSSLRAEYRLARHWSAALRVGYSRTRYYPSTRKDNQMMAGGTLNYNIAGNWGVAFDYRFLRLHTTLAGASHDNQIATIGVTYKY